MAEVRPDKFGSGGWSATGVGTNAGVTVTHTNTTLTPKVVGIQVSSDVAALVTVESPSGTVIWRKRYTAAFAISETFEIPLNGTAKANVLVKISASTANCEANIQGYDI